MVRASPHSSPPRRPPAHGSSTLDFFSDPVSASSPASRGGAGAGEARRQGRPVAALVSGQSFALVSGPAFAAVAAAPAWQACESCEWAKKAAVAANSQAQMALFSANTCHDTCHCSAQTPVGSRCHCSAKTPRGACCVRRTRGTLCVGAQGILFGSARHPVP